MERASRILAVLPGLLMGANGLRWLFDPAGAAESLGMPLLEGVGRSTQVGDLGAFFLVCSGLCLLGAWQRQAHWLWAAFALVAGAAAVRSWTALVHEAPFAAQFVVPELVMAAMLVFAARGLARRSPRAG